MPTPTAPAIPDNFLDGLFQKPSHRYVLDNGLTVIHRPAFTADAVSLQAWVKTGSIHEGDLLGCGISHYLEHLFFKGTERREGKAISREVHSFGGSINAYTSFDRTVYYIDGPASATAQGLDLLEDMLFHSTFPAEEVERERDVILREIDMCLDDPYDRLARTLFGTAFKHHPYREPVIGHRPLFEGITRDDLLTYYNNRYAPNNMVLVIVGAIDEATCRDLVEARFGPNPMRRLAPIFIKDEPLQLSARSEVVRGDYQVVRGGIAYKVPNLSHPASPHLDALAQALGGGESSLLWQRIRNEAKLVHHIDAMNWNPGSSGLFWISYTCDADKADAVEAAISEELAKVQQNGLPASVVNKALRNALASEINGRKTMSGQAARLGIGEVVIGDLSYPRSYLERLSSVTADDLQAAALAHLQPATSSAVRLVPGELERARTAATTLQKAAPFSEHQLSNGLKVLLQPDASLPKINALASFRAGPVVEAAGQRGITSLFSALLTKDTAHRSAAEVSEQAESLGAVFKSASGNNSLLLTLEVFPFDWDAGLGLVTDALVDLRLDQQTLERERDAKISDLKEEEDEVLDFGFRRLQRAFFGDHPFGIPADGEIDDLKAITLADLEAFRSRVIRPDNCVVAVAGDFEPAAMLQSLEQRLGTLPKPQDAKPIPEAPAFAGPKPIDTFAQKDREQAVVLVAYPDPGAKTNADGYLARVLNELFSGMSSRLFEQVRDTLGLAYYVASTRILFLDTGSFVFYAGTHPDKAPAVLEAIEGEISRVTGGGIEPEELAACKTRLLAGRTLSLQAIGSRARHAALNALYGEPIDDHAAFATGINSVTAEALSAYARTHLSADKRVRLIAGPGKAKDYFKS